MSDVRRTVQDWMSSQPATIGDDQPLMAARERMHHLGVRHLPVLHGGHLVGVVSERDIGLVEALQGDLAKVRVDEAMTPDPWTVRRDAAIAEVAATMAEKRIGTAIVIEGADQIVGLFTTTDALRALASFAE